jgi:phthalate 4,5-cis-dihydrodiol dehydrogenase
VRGLAGARALSVRAEVGRCDDARPTEVRLRGADPLSRAGALSRRSVYQRRHDALATATRGWVLDRARWASSAIRTPTVSARKRLATLAAPADETAHQGGGRTTGLTHRSIALDDAPPCRRHHHFGPLIVSCGARGPAAAADRRRDLRRTASAPSCALARRRPLPRAEVIDELVRRGPRAARRRARRRARRAQRRSRICPCDARIRAATDATSR